MKIGIGIDTGGTYTDAVIYDFEGQEILGAVKALTTKDDLAVGILDALDRLPEELVGRTEIISLSTTLATNACVEDKGGKAKLIFFGGDKKIIDEFGGKYGLPRPEDIYIQEAYTKFSGEIEREVDWDLFHQNINGAFDDFDGVGIIEINAMKNGAVVERKAKALFQERYGIPVVCGHELFSELNCLQRGSSTLLNARLFPVIQEFLEAIKTAMIRRGIKASVVIVRSDGSLMSEEFAVTRPVETLLCGPAASVIGAVKLSGDANSIIVDMGGTTTDVALVKNDVPVMVTDGVSIGKWKTFVDGLYVKTFGLGGDSAIHYNEKKLFLEEYRAVPLCVAAAKYPEVLENLKKLADNQNKHHLYLHEHYLLIKDLPQGSRYTEEEKTLCRVLKQGPMILQDAAAAVGRDIYNLNISRLIEEGYVQICSLTPTDIMHIKGDFTGFSSEASVLGAQIVAYNTGIPVTELCHEVYDEIKRKLYVTIVKVLLENKDKHFMKNGVTGDAEKLLNDAYTMAAGNWGKDGISLTFSTDCTLVGIGAPIHIFLPDVAEMLKTRAVIPEHHEVANALGAVMGNIYTTYTAEIRPNYTPGGITGYMVFGGDEMKIFETMDEAESFAVLKAKDGARLEAVKRGARGEISVNWALNKHEAEARDGAVYLGTTASAHALGSFGL
ncbi:MAG: hydantoinase/oxoprolinase family protein [Treponema sp.]|jgi:N-methylhydantoinase A/oxoprolinase/acetone carboxylase beta subunit|nr:hydantoinase/oxoprolinase family protein [Treponema sp.]